VATHDLELVKLSDEVPGIRNLHFEEYFADGTMHFSYQLKNGPCTSTNALHIMRQAGLPVQ
jgi:DNA mismatch repair ATPase MutS